MSSYRTLAVLTSDRKKTSGADHCGKHRIPSVQLENRSAGGHRVKELGAGGGMRVVCFRGMGHGNYRVFDLRNPSVIIRTHTLKSKLISSNTGCGNRSWSLTKKLNPYQIPRVGSYYYELFSSSFSPIERSFKAPFLIRSLPFGHFRKLPDSSSSNSDFLDRIGICIPPVGSGLQNRIPLELASIPGEPLKGELVYRRTQRMLPLDDLHFRDTPRLFFGFLFLSLGYLVLVRGLLQGVEVEEEVVESLVLGREVDSNVVGIGGEMTRLLGI
ncbi:hypothetical protein BDQ17DRAFT_1328885 [Cyathus striatus]|nr:hypothetical protein BDQ17DRAFT_1328885 [Cyathus striatus]